MQDILDEDGDKIDGLIRHIGKSTSNIPELNGMLHECFMMQLQIFFISRFGLTLHCFGSKGSSIDSLVNPCRCS